MKFETTNLNGVYLIKPEIFRDQRGFFLETFSNKWFEEQGTKVQFVQDNFSKSYPKGVLRGLHFQLPPSTQSKLVRVVNGAVYDVIVDLRKNSNTYGQWQGYELNNENNLMLFIPKGFAHGFLTLKENTEFFYKVDKFYAPQLDSGIIWNDETLKIDWPICNPIVSERDSKLQPFQNFNSPF